MMNRSLLFYLILFSVLVGCDNASNVEPTADQYFLKYYGQTGDQEGVDVKETPDGGFIIGGNSISTFGGTSDYLLIKTDAEGNQEWQETYDFGGDDRMTKVLVEANGYLIAGTSVVSGLKRTLLVRVDLQGEQDGDPYDIASNDYLTYDFECMDIFTTQSGDYLIVGGTNTPTTGGSVDGNAFLSWVYNDFRPVPKDSIKLEGSLMFAKTFEVDNNTGSYPNQTCYLSFGFEIEDNQTILKLYQYYQNLLPPPSSAQSYSFNNTEIVDVVQVEPGKFMVLASSSDVTSLIPVEEGSNGYYEFGAGQIMRAGNLLFEGTGLSISLNSNYIIAGNTLKENSTDTYSSIFEFTAFGSSLWQNQLGTTASSYTSGNVIVLTDGSVVYTGTAGLESQTKVFLVKMKSNGQMK